MIRFECPGCGRVVKAADGRAGSEGVCPGCGIDVFVPIVERPVPPSAVIPRRNGCRTACWFALLPFAVMGVYAIAGLASYFRWAYFGAAFGFDPTSDETHWLALQFSFIGTTVSLAIGGVPLFYGAIRGQIGAGLLGFVLTGVAGAGCGFVLSLPVAGYFVYVVATNGHR